MAQPVAWAGVASIMVLCWWRPVAWVRSGLGAGDTHVMLEPLVLGDLQCKLVRCVLLQIDDLPPRTHPANTTAQNTQACMCERETLRPQPAGAACSRVPGTSSHLPCDAAVDGLGLLGDLGLELALAGQCVRCGMVSTAGAATET